MMKRSIKGAVFFLLLFVFSACKSRKQQTKDPGDKPGVGTIHITVDESFRPVMEEQIRVYELSYPGAHIIASYKPEADCFKDFFRDSANRLVIVTRGLTDKEDRYMLDSLYYRPGWDKIATDAIAVLVNSKSNDTLFSQERLRQQLLGKQGREQQIVFDGLNATSTVRFIRDSILKGAAFDTSVVRAARNSSEVISFVAENENAIGLVGISWIGNPEDSAQLQLLKKVKIAYVQCSACEDSPYVKPMQESILTRRYPLVRGLYYIIKENYFGLGSDFVNFLKYERGQLIFRRAYLGPVMDFNIRNVKINEKLN
ncbi:MAG: substrate-binding domain-containing protein [Ferruginibacter sp.]